MFRDYFVFKWKSNGKTALACKKDELNQHIDFISANFKALNWHVYLESEVKELGLI